MKEHLTTRKGGLFSCKICQGGNMQKWEYERALSVDGAVQLPNPVPEVMYLNSLGEEGWELVAALRGKTEKGDDMTIFYLKREITHVKKLPKPK